MNTVGIRTNFNIDIEFTAPPFHRRLLAWVLDSAVLVLYVIVAVRVLTAYSRSLGYGDDRGMKLWAVELLLGLPFILYHVVLEATMNGQSIGKKIMGIKVVSDRGGKPSLSQYIIRWMIRTSDYMLLVIFVVIVLSTSAGMPVSTEMWIGVTIALGLLIVDLVLVNTKRQQRLGDMLAHTVLINTQQKDRITDTVFQEVAEGYVPQFPQIMQLSDRDINALKGIVDTARKHKDYNMAMMAAEKIKAHLKIDSGMEPTQFLDVLMKDYNYLSAN